METVPEHSAPSYKLIFLQFTLNVTIVVTYDMLQRFINCRIIIIIIIITNSKTC